MDAPRVYAESGTTLPEDRFVIDESEGFAMVRCVECDTNVVGIDDGDDLNTLVRLSGQHLARCRGTGEEST